MKVQAILCGLLLTTSQLSVGAGEKITMKASPEISFAPAHLYVRMNIEADADNHALEIVAQSEDFYRSSTIELNGDKAPRTTVVEFRSLPSGQYDVTSRLVGRDGETRGYVHREINVLPAGER